MECAELTQYGVTWIFDRPVTCGQFITGDWWVVGPVTVTRVSPAPGPGRSEQSSGTVKSIYGTVSMVDDSRMRNGSMIVLRPGAEQGYDSRIVNYEPDLSITFPCTLRPEQSLISTISHETFPVEVMHHALMWKAETTGPVALKSAAVLTCLTQAPPPDAFRPPYAGTEKPIYSSTALQWERLPRLPPPGEVPDWAEFERYYQRPWLDHIDNWMLQVTGPSENQINYGREFSRINSIASLMLMLDFPRETKEKLLRGFVQWGIDLSGLVKCARRWSADGGHWNGRKWPILFAGLLLGDKSLQALPSSPGALFSEDQQTYFGQGWHGQRVLYQMVWHTVPRLSYEEKDPRAWNDGDRRSELYRGTCSVGWPGTALAVLLMEAKALWNHDAFFDYCDRWMEDKASSEKKCLNIAGSSGRADPFVEAMWASYRKRVPQQSGGATARKWIWSDLERSAGEFVPNQSDG